MFDLYLTISLAPLSVNVSLIKLPVSELTRESFVNELVTFLLNKKN